MLVNPKTVITVWIFLDIDTIRNFFCCCNSVTSWNYDVLFFFLIISVAHQHKDTLSDYLI